MRSQPDHPAHSPRCHRHGGLLLSGANGIGQRELLSFSPGLLARDMKVDSTSLDSSGNHLAISRDGKIAIGGGFVQPLRNLTSTTEQVGMVLVLDHQLTLEATNLTVFGGQVSGEYTCAPPPPPAARNRTSPHAQP